MVENDNCCCICGGRPSVRLGPIPPYFCASCFSTHKEDVVGRVAWVLWLVNEEKQRRKRRNRLLEHNISLFPLYASQVQASALF